MIKKITQKLWGWVKPYLTPKMIPILLVLWMITNGQAYIIGYLGLKWGITWMKVYAGSYLALLWSPFAPEKLLILLVAPFVYRAIYREKFVKREDYTK